MIYSCCQCSKLCYIDNQILLWDKWRINTIEENLLSFSLLYGLVYIKFPFCGRGCICWGIFVTAGSGEAHWRLCESWLLCSKCYNPKVGLHLSRKAWFQLSSFVTRRRIVSLAFVVELIFFCSCFCDRLHLLTP